MVPLKPYLPLGIATLEKNFKRTQDERVLPLLFLWEHPFYHTRNISERISLEKLFNLIHHHIPYFTHGELSPEKPFFGGIYTHDGEFAVKISRGYIEVSSKSDNSGKLIADELVKYAEQSIV